MKKHLLFLFAALLPLVASAHDFEANGIYYNITSEADKTAEVTYKGYSFDSYYNEYSGSITIPATVTHNGTEYSVTSIGNEAFRECSSLTTINIPEGVTWIGSSAFFYCSSLTFITIPEGVTSIESNTFYGCSSLTAITIPKSVTSIGYRAFTGCRSLTAITLPEGVTSIGNEAFYNCSSLTSIILPEGVTSIGSYTFYNCSSLTAITLPEGVTSIGYQAFRGCSSLKTVINYSDLDIRKGSSDYGYVAYYADIAVNVDEFISDYAFKTIEGVHYLTGYVGNNTELTLPTDYQGNIYQIGDYAFYNCSSLTAITIPEGVTSIGDWAFYNCSSLTSITIPENSQLTSIGEWAFSSCSDLTAITLPESVTSIGDHAFSGCSSLESLHIGPNVDSYGSEAFAGCTAIKELTVMGNVMPEIPSENLTSITLYSPIPLVTKEFASKVYRNATLNIPDGSLTRYQNADVWKNFWYINEFDPKKGKDVYLTINQADNGYVKQHLTEGTVCTFTIVAAEGWKIHSVTFNDTDVTTQLTAEGIYTTPALQADAVLNIAYEKSGDNAIEKASANRIKVQGHRGTLRVTGATEGESISVYTTSGTLVANETAEDDETELSLPTGQVYIVKVADKVVKIGM